MKSTLECVFEKAESIVEYKVAIRDVRIGTHSEVAYVEEKIEPMINNIEPAINTNNILLKFDVIETNQVLLMQKLFALESKMGQKLCALESKMDQYFNMRPRAPSYVSLDDFDFGSIDFETPTMPPVETPLAPAAGPHQTLPGGSPAAEGYTSLPKVPALTGGYISPPDCLVKASVAENVGTILRDRKLAVRHIFSLKLVGAIFSREELARGNCHGTHGAARLHEDKILYVKNLTMNKFPCSMVEKEETVWKQITEKVDAKHRNEKKNQSRWYFPEGAKK